MNVLAYQIADSVDIKGFKSAFKTPIEFSDSDSLYYKTDPDKFIYACKYGVVSFLNYNEAEISTFFWASKRKWRAAGQEAQHTPLVIFPSQIAPHVLRHYTEHHKNKIMQIIFFHVLIEKKIVRI